MQVTVLSRIRCDGEVAVLQKLKFKETCIELKEIFRIECERIQEEFRTDFFSHLIQNNFKIFIWYHAINV